MLDGTLGGWDAGPMYPYVRLAKELVINRRAPRLRIGEIHRSGHICWPWGIDMFCELNNGRTLTLFDLGRFGMLVRLNFLPAARARRWAGSVAGSSIRYRRRVRMFDRVEMRSRMIGWDRRFFYSEQSLWRGETCCSHALVRIAVTGPEGMVPPGVVVRELQFPEESPTLPDWAMAWAESDGARPWPPMAEAGVRAQAHDQAVDISKDRLH